MIRFTCIMCTKKLSSMQHGVRVPKCKTNVIFKGGPELSQAQPCWCEGLIELGLSWAKTGMIKIRGKYWKVSEVVSFR